MAVAKEIPGMLISRIGVVGKHLRIPRPKARVEPKGGGSLDPKGGYPDHYLPHRVLLPPQALLRAQTHMHRGANAPAGGQGHLAGISPPRIPPRGGYRPKKVDFGHKL